MILKNRRNKNKYLMLNKEERKKYLNTIWERFVDIKNLTTAYNLSRRGKYKKRSDAIIFSYCASVNLLKLQESLLNGTYNIMPYKDFFIKEKKQRHIQTMTFRDKIVQRAISNVILDILEPKFIKNSYACLRGRGVQRALLRLQNYLKASKINYKNPYYLKMDVSKFFPSIDRDIMYNILCKHIPCENMLKLLKRIMDMNPYPIGMPLGNLTSQLFANLYMNELDQYIKHKLRVKKYIRYADDLLFIVDSKEEAIRIRDLVTLFLKEKLKLTINPNKVFICKANKLNALGSVVYTDRIKMGNRVKRSFIKHIKKGNVKSLNSWYGCVGLCKCHSFIYKNLSRPEINIHNIRFDGKKFIDMSNLAEEYLYG